MSTHPQASQIARAQTNRKIPWEYEDCGGGRFLFSHARRVSRLVGTSTMSRDETECAFAQIRCLICFPWPADRRSERHEVQKQFSGPYSRDLTAALWLPPGVSSESVTRLTTSHVIRDATGRSPRGRKGGENVKLPPSSGRVARGAFRKRLVSRSSTHDYVIRQTALTSIKLLRLAVLEHRSDRSQPNENHRGVGGRIALVQTTHSSI